MNTTLLMIGQVAVQSGVSRDTIRYYERLGLLPSIARTPSGYRLYSQEIIRRLWLIRNGLRFGFSLKQLAVFLGSRDRGTPPCQNVRDAGRALLSAIEKQIGELTAVRNAMQTTLRDWDKRLSATPPGVPADLL